MGSLLTYSGLTTKVRAMKSRLLTESQYRELAEFDTVSGAVDYLKKFPAYKPFLSGKDGTSLHRGKIEELLLQSKYDDFSKIYRFSGLSQRKFLDLYFMHYEIAKLKRCLRGVIANRPLEIDFSLFQEFFDRHSSLNLLKLSSSEDLNKFISNLEGSPYYDIMARLNRQENTSLFDYESNLDMLYFKTMWKAKNSGLKKREQYSLAKCFGNRLDMLNIQWIYRCIQYYHMTSSEIYALLIPVQNRIKPEQLYALANAEHTDEFFHILQHTYYGNLNPVKDGSFLDPETLARQVLNRIHKLTEQRDPYSIATVNSYLYFKELEIEHIIHIIESIRYGLEPAQILSAVMKIT